MQTWRKGVLAVVLATTLAACDDDEATAVQEPDIVELAAETPELSTLVTAVQEAGLVDALKADGPYMVFAPVNSAFADLDAAALNRLLEDGNVDLLQKVLTYHVVPGRLLASNLSEGAQLTTLEGGNLTVSLQGGATVNGVSIVATDITADNGVVHLIDGVLLDHLDIVDVARVNGLTSLVSAVQQAGLVDALRGNGGGNGLMVFAPTNDAFAALGTVPSDPAVLSEVLLYHVVDGRVPSTALSDNQQITTLQGGTARIDLSSGVTVEGANNSADVVQPNVSASNGVIHVIDAVLLPPSS